VGAQLALPFDFGCAPTRYREVVLTSSFHRWQFEPFSRTLSLTSEYSYTHDDARSKNSSLSDTTLCCRCARSERVPISLAPLRNRGSFE
jgi:hypothetical protein